MFNNKIYLHLFILTSFLSHNSLAQPIDIKFELLKSENNLPSLKVTCLIEDKKGFIWIGTDAGLARYDGYKFKIYTHDPHDSTSLSSNHIYQMYVDRVGTLWAFTDFGLNKFVRKTDNFKSYFVKDKLGGGFDENFDFMSIFEDSKNLFWIKSFSLGLFIFDKEKEEFEKINKYIKDSLTVNLFLTRHIFEDNKNNLLFITYNKGIFKYDILSGKLTQYSGNNKYPNGFPETYGYPTIASNDNTLWAGFSSSLNIGLRTITIGDINNFSPDSVEFKHYSKKQLGLKDTITCRVSSIIEDKSGIMWIGTNSGLCLVNSQEVKFYNVKIVSNTENEALGNSISAVTEDKKGIIWLATEKGISFYNGNAQKFPVYSYDIPNNQETNLQKITSIHEDNDGILWLASGNYLIKWNRTKGLIKKISPDSLGTRKFKRFFIDTQNIHWLICENSNVLRKYNSEKNEINNFYRNMNAEGTGGMFINEMYEDTEGILWLSTLSGLCSFGIDRKLINIYRHDDKNLVSISHDITNEIYEDKEGKIWVSTHTGLDRLDKKTGEFTHFKSTVTDSTGLSNNIITSFHDDGQGYMWITTYGGGLNRYDKKTDKFICINEKDGFVSNFMHNILSDDHGNLWISTNKGISKFDPSNLIIKNYNAGDGLQGDEFGVVAFKSKSGEMFFGGENGLNVFHPDSIKENTNIPPVVLTSFKIFNKEAKLEKSIIETDEIKISYKDNFFSIEFSALDYTNPIKNQYMYMLEGIDKDWVKTPSTKREASYTDIDPGEYLFRVKGSNNDGVWNEEGATVKIIITPPWWQTWWFRGCGIVLIIGLLGYVRQRKLSKIRNEMRRKEDFTRQLIDSQEQERKRIAGELHDSLGQNLLMVKNRTILSLKDKELNDNIRDSLNEISGLTSEALTDIRAISYNLRPYELDRIGLTKTIESLIEKVEKSTTIKFKTEINEIDDMYPAESEIIIYRIIQECINNIIKHSGANEAEIRIDRDFSNVIININDTGKGFDLSKSEGKGGFGLKGIMERVNLIRGNIKIESLIGKGTSVQIILPYIN